MKNAAKFAKSFNLMTRIGLPTLFILAVIACSKNKAQSLVQDADSDYQGNIRISLAHPFDLKTEDFEILLSSTYETSSMAICHVKTADATCTPESQLFYKSQLIYANGTRKFFKVNASALLEDGLTLQAVALDKDGKPIDSRRFYLKSKLITDSTTTATGSNAGSATAATN